MRIILLGKHGQLGWELCRTLAPLGEIFPLDYPEIDLIQPESAIRNILEIQPQIIVNATAYTQVDRAESEPEIAMAVNARAPGKLAETAAAIGAALIHYSTDYVFDGEKGAPYVEEDAPNPMSVYGQSKLAGEQAIERVGGAYLILRTSWVYSLRRDSFVIKVLKWSRENLSIHIVDDQIGSPTWARMLAEVSAMLLVEAGHHAVDWIGDRKGIYHLAGEGAASRFEWAKEILRVDPRAEEHICQEILPARSNDFPTPAVRPHYSALQCDLFRSTFGLSLPNWKDALQFALEH